MSQGLTSDREPLARLLGDPVGSQGPQSKDGVPGNPAAQTSPPTRPHGGCLAPPTRELRFSISFVLSAKLAL